MSAATPLPTTLKWSKKVYRSIDDPRLAILPGSSTNDYKSTIQQITGVPIARQKLLCKHGWKGTLSNDATFDAALCIPPNHSSLTITLIGSAEKLAGPPPAGDRPRFLEDITPQELEAERMRQQQIDEDKAEGMIVALQRPPGELRDADSNRSAEPYQYKNRLVYAVPQYRIEHILKTRRMEQEGKLMGNVIMTLGLELRRSYVNDLATLPDGTLVSALDDGHVQLWRHAELVEDVVYGNPERGGVEHVVALPPLQDGSGGGGVPAFATAGQGVVKLWNDDGEGLAALQSPPGTSPCALVATTVGRGEENDESLLLATSYKVTYQPDPNQFRLVPQDEAGRQRRAEAEEQERQLQQRVGAAAGRVGVFIRRGNQVQQIIIDPPASGGRGREGLPSPIKSLATLSHNEGTILVCGNANGNLRLVQFRHENNLQFTEYKQMHLHPTDGSTASIVCMESIGGSLLAVSTRQEPADASRQPLPDSVAVNVPIAQAVYIFDTERCTCNLILNAHSDAVLAMCMLPDGGLATCGGKMDAKTRVWDKAQLNAGLDGTVSEDSGETRILTESAATLDEVGYVFALSVLPDTKSTHYALAAARYNTIKICI